LADKGDGLSNPIFASSTDTADRIACFERPIQNAINAQSFLPLVPILPKEHLFL
jgi:hypothetical protein